MGDPDPLELDPDNLFGLPPLSPDELKRLHGHIEELVAEHGLTWDEEEMSWLGAEADLDERRLWSPIMRREWDYLAALHEVGHLVLERRTKDDDGEIIWEDEIDVWRWTKEEALVDPGPEAKEEILLAFQSQDEEGLLAGPGPGQLARMRALFE